MVQFGWWLVTISLLNCLAADSKKIKLPLNPQFFCETYLLFHKVCCVEVAASTMENISTHA